MPHSRAEDTTEEAVWAKVGVAVEVTSDTKLEAEDGSEEGGGGQSGAAEVEGV